MSAGQNYGSIDESALTDKSFDADNAYYLKNESGNNSGQPQQKCRKFLVAGLPILIAIAIIGGAVLYLLKDFSSLYPGRGGGGSSSTHRAYSAQVDVSSYKAAKGESSETSAGVRGPKVTPPNSEGGKVTGGDAACSAHEGCSKLRGDCCPTADGIHLSCCAR